MNHHFLIGSAQLNQAFEINNSTGGGSSNSGLTRRSFIKRTGGATMATLVTWQAFQGTANACNCGCSPGCHYSEVKYMFIVPSPPHMTNPDQIETAWKNKKIPSSGTPSGEHFDDEIYCGPWDSGGNEFYAVYKFTADGPHRLVEGPTEGETGRVSIGGKAWGELYEDDLGDRLADWYADDDDLEAKAECVMSSRTWTMDEDTGEITEPQEVLEISQPASPGAGYARCKVSLGEFVGRVAFN